MNEDELNLLKLQETANSDKSSQQDILSAPSQPFEFTINDKQHNTLTEQNLVSKQQFETRDNQNLTHSPVTSAKSPLTTPNTQLSDKSVFPRWIIQQREQLVQKYPRDRFDIVQKPNNNFRMRCSDCPGRLYQLGPGNSLENFEVHLKNREHRQNVEKRLNSDWTVHETGGSVIDNGGAIPGTIDASEFSSPVSGTGDSFTSLNTNNRAVEGSNTQMRSDFSRLHSSPSSQSLEMSESAKSSRGGTEITGGINDVNSPGYETIATGVFIDNSNGIPPSKTEAFSSKSKGPL